MREPTPEEVIEEIYNQPRLKGLMANELRLSGKVEHALNIASKSVWYRLWKNEKSLSEQRERTDANLKCVHCGTDMTLSLS